MKLKILLTGKNGQVGGDLAQLLPRLGEVTALDRRQLDLAKPSEIRRVVQDIRPNVIVNAAAYTAVDQAEKEEALARVVNADAPGIMAEEAKNIGALLVHYSTDYVFDGSKTTPYMEDDPPNPLNAYGSTKLAGEHAIAASGAPHLILRTEWVYATRGRNFLLTILRLATQHQEFKVVNDQIGSPTWSREIATATARIIEKLAGQTGSFTRLPEIRATYHMTAAGQASWYDFARKILEIAARIPKGAGWFAAATGNRPLLATRVVPIPTSEYPTLARRPAYSLLSNSLLARTFGIRLPDWQEQLESAIARDE